MLYLPHESFIKTRDFTQGTFNFEPAESIVGEEEDHVYNYDRLTALSHDLGKPYLDILFMDALCFNVDRHTKNYGILRSQSTGEIIGMAPNFDNNIALISRGYGPDPTATNGILIDMFAELLSEKGLSYPLPVLDKAALCDLAECTLPHETIDREYVISMISERWQRTAEKFSRL